MFNSTHFTVGFLCVEFSESHMRIEIKCVRKSVKSTKNLNCISTTSIIRLLAECFFDLFNVKVLWICDWHFTWILSIVLPPNHHTRIDLNTDHNPFPNVSAFLTKNFLFLLFEKPNATIGIVIEDNKKMWNKAKTCAFVHRAIVLFGNGL